MCTPGQDSSTAGSLVRPVFRYQAHLDRACFLFWFCFALCAWEDKLGMLSPTDSAILDSGQDTHWLLWTLSLSIYTNPAFTWAHGVRRFQFLSLLLMLCFLPVEYRHTSEMLWVQIQVTTIKRILQESKSHEFFAFLEHRRVVFILYCSL